MRAISCWPLGVAVVAMGTAVACAPRPTAEVEPRMVGHFQNVSQLYAAAAQGQLEAVHAAARELLERETGTGLPPKATPHVEEMRAFAGLAARAPDLRSAASAAARVGASCGSCHKTMKRGPVYKVVSTPPEGSTPVATRMMRHRWAADRLWDGLVGPSEESWRAGTSALKDAPLFTDELTQNVEQYAEVTKLAWTVHEVGALAAGARDQAARADLYGTLLATCAGCHMLLRGATAQ